MKELSIEEKAKRYDIALDKIKRLLGTGSNCSREELEYVFPELAESEDERIRKELIEYIKDQQSSFISAPDCRDKYEEEENNKYNSWIAWLEKQGEQKPAEWHREDEQNLNACLGYIPDEFLRRWLMDVIHAKYDKPADKVEPKFHEGEWITIKE